MILDDQRAWKCGKTSCDTPRHYDNFSTSPERMGQQLLIRRRQQPNFLLITTLTLLSLSTLTTCTSEYTTRDVSHNKHNFPKTDRAANYSQEAVTNYKYETKDTSMYRNDTGSFVDTATKPTQSIGHVPTIYNLPLETNSDLNWSLSSGLTLLKVISSISQNCWNKSDGSKCVWDTVIRFMNSVLHSSDSYRISHNVRDNEPAYDELLNNMEGNITVLQKMIMKKLRNYELSANLGGIGNQVEDSARAALYWFKPGKSL